MIMKLLSVKLMALGSAGELFMIGVFVARVLLYFIILTTRQKCPVYS